MNEDILVECYKMLGDCYSHNDPIFFDEKYQRNAFHTFYFTVLRCTSEKELYFRHDWERMNY